MDGFRVRTLTLIVAAALIATGVGLALGVFVNNEPEPAAPATNATAGVNEPEAGKGNGGSLSEGPTDGPELPPTESDPEGLVPGPSGPAPSSTDELAATKAARSYVEAIDARRGRKLCGAFEPGSDEPQERLDLPETRQSCSASFEASFGYEGNDGQPAWARSEMTEDVSAQTDGDSARVVATVFTEYADVREPTVEDDIIYLSRATGRWLVIKPSATLYRAVGIADIPLAAIRPPG